MGKTPKIELASESTRLMAKILEIKARVPQGIAYIPYYEQLFGQQSDEQKEHIRRVWNLRATDEEITNNLEKMVEHIKAA